MCPRLSDRAGGGSNARALLRGRVYSCAECQEVKSMAQVIIQTYFPTTVVDRKDGHKTVTIKVPDEHFADLSSALVGSIGTDMGEAEKNGAYDAHKEIYIGVRGGIRVYNP